MTTRINRKTAGFYNSVIVWQEVGTAYPNYPRRFRPSVIKVKLLFTVGIQLFNKLNICYILIFCYLISKKWFCANIICISDTLYNMHI